MAPGCTARFLGLDLAAEGAFLRFWNPRTGERLRTHEEAEAERRVAEAQAFREMRRRQLAEEQAQREAAARKAAEAEAEAERLRQELARLREGKNNC